MVDFGNFGAYCFRVIVMGAKVEVFFIPGNLGALIRRTMSRNSKKIPEAEEIPKGIEKQ